MSRQPGVLATRVGYTGGGTLGPVTYESVSGGDGHSEAVRVWFDPRATSYEALVEAYFEGHQPRWPVRRKARSAIWSHSEEQHAAAAAAVEAREARLGRACHVAVERAGAWHEADESHQQYLQKLDAEAQEQ